MPKCGHLTSAAPPGKPKHRCGQGIQIENWQIPKKRKHKYCWEAERNPISTKIPMRGGCPPCVKVAGNLWSLFPPQIRPAIRSAFKFCPHKAFEVSSVHLEMRNLPNESLRSAGSKSTSRANTSDFFQICAISIKPLGISYKYRYTIEISKLLDSNVLTQLDADLMWLESGWWRAPGLHTTAQYAAQWCTLLYNMVHNGTCTSSYQRVDNRWAHNRLKWNSDQRARGPHARTPVTTNWTSSQ